MSSQLIHNPTATEPWFPEGVSQLSRVNGTLAKEFLASLAQQLKHAVERQADDYGQPLDPSFVEKTNLMIDGCEHLERAANRDAFLSEEQQQFVLDQIELLARLSMADPRVPSGPVFMERLLRLATFINTCKL